MRLFGNDANLQPSPNPKPLAVQRIRHEIIKDGHVVGHEDILIKNTRVFPRELIERR